MIRLLATALLAAALVQSAAGAESTTGPQAEWIWTAAPRPAGQTACFRKEFVVEGEVAGTELRAAADHCGATVYLNGQRVGGIEPYGPPLRRDAGRLVREGRNVLAVQGEKSDGPAAIAIDLELSRADGRAERVVTDASWLASTTAAAGWSEAKPVTAEDWKPASSYGAAEAVFWADPETDTGVTELEDYTQWTRALGAEAGTDPATFRVPAGYEIERLRSAAADEGSWVSLAFDPRGRPIIAREDKGLLRLTLPGDGGEVLVEVVDDSLQECRGLLHTADALYANANNSKALFRLRDTDGDGRYDEQTALRASEGGVGHGRNDLALGPGGDLYLIHGDSVELPRNFFDRTSPFREHRKGEKTSEGHLLRLNPNGGDGETIAAGLRNPFGVDFNGDGEAFTYDADAEHDMGTPWYRPTRIVHLVSGADYGWRGVTGSWPPYYPDQPEYAPATLDVGKGSPTAVKFGTRSAFPPEDRRALFVLDWAYGRILAVRFAARGAGYVARAETFLKGHPLNVTDLDFGPDGAMYFVTGGRKTQSALYRARYVGPATDEAAPTAQQAARAEHAAGMRALRRRLEMFHGRRDSGAAAEAWAYLGSADPLIRHAARIAIEHQPVEEWRDRALAEADPAAAPTALLALARSGELELHPRILSRIGEFPLPDMTDGLKLISLRVHALCLARPESIDMPLREAVVRRLDSLFPSGTDAVDRELSRLLVALGDPGAVSKSVERLLAATDQRERVDYLLILRDARGGWTPELRRAYFLSLRQMNEFVGGDGMPKFVQQLQADALASLSEDERTEYGPMLAAAEAEAAATAEPRPFVREWTLADLEALAAAREGGSRDFEMGKALFTAALCDRCHRVGALGAAVGPDLSAVGRRFSRRDILRSILSPSDVVAEQYRRAQVVLKDGRVLTGQIVPGRDYRSPTLRVAADPLRPGEVVEVAKADVESHTTSATSIMPAGLLNTLTEEEILDLVGWLESGGRQASTTSRR